MSYEIVLLPAAVRQLKKLSQKARKQVSGAIDSLSADPRPHGYKKLHGQLKDYYRIQTGNYRVIYSIHDNTLLIVIVKVGDRKDIY